MTAHRPLVLAILDGFGHADDANHNAIAKADTPNWDRYWSLPTARLIDCSGLVVGLPEGQMGNSEVGHMHIGAGRTIYQELTRIDASIANGEFAKNPVFLRAIDDARQSNSALHIMGLCSPGGVHSHESHLLAMLDLAIANNAPSIQLHLFLDGRDTPPKSALASIEKIAAHLQAAPNARIASITGRYFAMDRDKRWDRIQKAYECLLDGRSDFHYDDAISALHAAYDRGETDEFVQPSVITPAASIEDGDSVIFMNFRADRARQLSHALIDADFAGFKRHRTARLKHFITLTQYSTQLDAEVAFVPQSIHNSFGEVVANAGLRQLRIAETEKYAHVTFFFNGGQEQTFPNEQRILIDSPKVATYDLQPQMSAPELTDAIVDAIESQQFDVIICNYANPDMVGHTGNMDATITAIECVDACLGRIESALTTHQGELIITADHGNAECLFDDDSQQAHTAHTSTPIPFVYVGRNAKMRSGAGSLIDLAPTMLQLLGLQAPQDMTGQTLLSLED